MSDEEIICTFMEPLVAVNGATCGHDSPARWWVREPEWSDTLKWGAWHPRTLTLDALWEVQERLTEEQWARYESRFDQRRRVIARRCHCGVEHLSRHRASSRKLLHASPEQKIKALGPVLLPYLESK